MDGNGERYGDWDENVNGDRDMVMNDGDEDGNIEMEIEMGMKMRI